MAKDANKEGIYMVMYFVPTASWKDSDNITRLRIMNHVAPMISEKDRWHKDQVAVV